MQHSHSSTVQPRYPYWVSLLKMAPKSTCPSPSERNRPARLTQVSVGAGDWATARRSAWLDGWMALATTGLIGLAVGLFPLRVASLFTPDGQVAGLAASALRYIGFGGFGIGMAMYFASLGAGRMTAPVFGGLARLAVAVGGGAILSHFWGRDGNFIAVAPGIVAYGVTNAMGVNGRSWRARG